MKKILAKVLNFVSVEASKMATKNYCFFLAGEPELPEELKK